MREGSPNEPRIPIQTAQALLDKYGVSVPPVPVERIAKKEGARIQYGPLDRELSGMFFLKDGVPVIGVNSLHHPNRQRFTISHELAHMLLHRDQIEGGVHVDKGHAILRRDALSATGEDKIEVEANQFASNFLVPDFLLARVLGENCSIVDDEQELEMLSKKFKVSTMTMQIRLQHWFQP